MPDSELKIERVSLVTRQLGVDETAVFQDAQKRVLLDTFTGRQRLDFLGVMFHYGEYSIRHIPDYARR